MISIPATFAFSAKPVFRQIRFSPNQVFAIPPNQTKFTTTTTTP